MGQITMNLYIDHLRRRYRKAGKIEKGQILDEFCKSSDYHRKSATRLLNHAPKHEKHSEKGGRPPKYDHKQLREPLKMNLVCNGSAMWEIIKREPSAMARVL